MSKRVNAFDWSRTPLGPMDRWPQSLRTAVGICLNSPVPMFVWWGPDLINIYNDAYAPVLGRRHPDALGRSAPQVWADIWAVIADDVDAVVRRGKSVTKERVRFVMDRNGYPEETYFTYSHSPIPDDHGGIGGLFQVCTDETARVRAEAAQQELLTQLARQAQVFDTALTHINDFAYTFDRDGRFIYVNKPLLDLWGLPLEEAVGKNFFDLKYPD